MQEQMGLIQYLALSHPLVVAVVAALAEVTLMLLLEMVVVAVA
jgi:hypothetical protein